MKGWLTSSFYFSSGAVIKKKKETKKKKKTNILVRIGTYYLLKCPITLSKPLLDGIRSSLFCGLMSHLSALKNTVNLPSFNELLLGVEALNKAGYPWHCSKTLLRASRKSANSVFLFSAYIFSFQFNVSYKFLNWFPLFLVLHV